MSPLVAADAPDGLFADLSGCTHLFGGETAFLERLCADLRNFRWGGWLPITASIVPKVRTPSLRTSDSGAIRDDDYHD
ncbi:hypothetical protein, partial [Asaia bogorensis]|uniref:hypothetical protein n=2 Tax=Asaia bogorensis TaxID=91915 RepID=UPI00301A2935